jgi:hypothetical protein
LNLWRPFFTAPNKMSIAISSFLVPKCYYERMQDLAENEWLSSMTYDEFRDWNMHCIMELTNEEDAWMVGLCRRIKDNKVILMDMETPGAQWVADSFYFNENREVIIVNPR